MNTRLRLALAGGLVGLALLAVFYRTAGWAQASAPVQTVEITLSQPDVLVRTQSVSGLFRDLLKVPLARDLLGEDLVFYYESHPDRLGLTGTLRRIAYEHDVTWTDRAVATVFDEPADIMLWRGPKGALDYWTVAMSRGTLATLLQEAATLAARDRQLQLAGMLTIEGVTLPVLALEYAPRRTLLIASRGDRVVVLSEPGVLFRDDYVVRPERAAVVARLLSASPGLRNVHDGVFPLGDATFTHTVAVRAHYLSFGYQRFFPGLEALRLDFGSSGWSTSVLMDGARLPAGAMNAALWNAVPANAAMCAILPVDWAQGRTLAAQAPGAGERLVAALAQRLDGAAVTCWYDDGQLQTPLVAAALQQPTDEFVPLFTSIFDWGIRKPSDAPATVPARVATTATWQREVTAPFTSVDRESGRPQPGLLTVTLANAGRYLFFSPDGAQVTRALATVDRRYPSMADVLPADGVTLATVSPTALAALGRKEALVMLPRDDEPVFRAAAERQLFPRLDAVGKYPAYRLALRPRLATGRRWEPVSWEVLAR